MTELILKEENLNVLSYKHQQTDRTAFLLQTESLPSFGNFFFFFWSVSGSFVFLGKDKYREVEAEACERNRKQHSDDRNVTYCVLEAKLGDKTRFLK